MKAINSELKPRLGVKGKRMEHGGQSAGYAHHSGNMAGDGDTVLAFTTWPDPPPREQHFPL